MQITPHNQERYYSGIDFHSLRSFSPVLKHSEVEPVDQRLVRFSLFDKHQHIDGIVADPVRYADITVMKDIRFRDGIVLIGHYIGKSRMPGIVLSGFDFNGQNRPGLFHQKIKLTLLFAVEAVKLKAVSL